MIFDSHCIFSLIFQEGSKKDRVEESLQTLPFLALLLTGTVSGLCGEIACCRGVGFLGLHPGDQSGKRGALWVPEEINLTSAGFPGSVEKPGH